jgi:hypothetical protein
MEQTIIAKFKVDDDPDVSHLPDYQQSYMKYQAEVRAMKIKQFLEEYAAEFSFL